MFNFDNRGRKNISYLTWFLTVNEMAPTSQIVISSPPTGQETRALYTRAGMQASMSSISGSVMAPEVLLWRRMSRYGAGS